MFNQVNLTAIVKSCRNVSFNDKPATVLCAEIFGDKSSVYMVSFHEIDAEAGDIISVTGSITTRKFDVLESALIESDRRGYARVLVTDHQLQRMSVSQPQTQQTTEQKPSDAPAAANNLNIARMSDLVIVKREGYSIWFAGYADPFVITKKTKNTVLLDVQPVVDAVVYTNDAGKRYLNEVHPATQMQKTA
jgi:hypothetical protein